MRAYLIDPVARSVSHINYQGSSDIRKIINCRLIKVAHRWKTGDALYVDEECLFKHRIEEDGSIKYRQHFFRLKEKKNQPFAGKGLLIRQTSNGYADPSMDIHDLRQKISYYQVVSV